MYYYFVTCLNFLLTKIKQYFSFLLCFLAIITIFISIIFFYLFPFNSFVNQRIKEAVSKNCFYFKNININEYFNKLKATKKIFQKNANSHSAKIFSSPENHTYYFSHNYAKKSGFFSEYVIEFTGWKFIFNTEKNEFKKPYNNIYPDVDEVSIECKINIFQENIYVFTKNDKKIYDHNINFSTPDKIKKVIQWIEQELKENN